MLLRPGFVLLRLDALLCVAKKRRLWLKHWQLMCFPLRSSNRWTSIRNRGEWARSPSTSQSSWSSTRSTWWRKPTRSVAALSLHRFKRVVKMSVSGISHWGRVPLIRWALRASALSLCCLFAAIPYSVRQPACVQEGIEGSAASPPP